MFFIGFETSEDYARAVDLARQFDLIIDNTHLPRLHVSAEHLSLYSDSFSPLWVDFCSKKCQRRHQEGKQQGLVRACKPSSGVKILDLTAGWGRDAAILASFGAHVLMLERHPLMAALLMDGLARYGENSTTRLSLACRHMDAFTYLPTLSLNDYPDVIYIDPMHPQRQKSALVKKDLQILQGLIGADDDAKELIELARHYARVRVVVKWPQHAVPLVSPTHSVGGKTVRFDVYSARP